MHADVAGRQSAGEHYCYLSAATHGDGDAIPAADAAQMQQQQHFANYGGVSFPTN